MPDFKETGDIVLQPADSAVPYTFSFSINTAAAANDGSIPYGLTIASVVVTAHSQAGADVTAQLVVSQSLSGIVETVGLTYPATAGVGTYHLRFVCTLSSGPDMEFDFNRIRTYNR